MLDDRIKKDLLDRYQAMQASGGLLSKTQLDEYYATFRRHFGPDVLAKLDGEALLSAMHDHGNRDSLVYWLEFKNDDEFPTLQFGSIAGGSALKFGIYKRNETGTWMTGSPQKQQELSLSDAISVARHHRDQLIAGAERLARLPDSADDGAYAQLQIDLARIAPNIHDTAWGHKYFSLLYPDRLDDYHNPDYQRFHLVKMLLEPPTGEGRYICAQHFVNAAHELEMPISHLTKLLNERDGRPHRYWHVLANYSDPPFRLWDLMRAEKCVAAGWALVGNLSGLKYDQASRNQLQALMSQHYKAPGRWTSEIFWFATLMAEGDLVLAMEGDKVLGIGRITGGYQHVAHPRAPHRRPVEWLDGTTWTLPESEATNSNVRDIKFYANQIEVERRLLAPVWPPIEDDKLRPSDTVTPSGPTSGRRQIPPLAGIPGRVQTVLDRKRQVILYGPPGTGKTYWARLAALDLAAYAAFGAAFDQLTTEQQKVALGDGREQAGLVRLCAFHPAYGYEDFLEGYRPLPPRSEGGPLAFELRDGIFKRLCDDARSDPDRRYFLIVDEINRGDIPRIFGELLTVLERDKRGRSILLPLSGQPFSVPDNVYLIGTMNTADRSIALLDTALRRRFGFVELMPDSRVLGKTVLNGIPLGPWLDALNRRICEHVGRDARNLQVGHAYLLDGDQPVADFTRFTRIVQDDIVPLLEEYCYEDYDALEKILGTGLVDRTGQRIRHEVFDPSRQEELIAALLTPAPEITASLSATTAAAEAPGEEAGVGDDNDDEAAAAA